MIQLNDVDEAARGRPFPVALCSFPEPKAQPHECYWCKP